ncbi:MAG: hypothetical protein ACRDCT_08170 [Shewanella sp.]|uniref:hypothetical protein n=1 Tax=Shewanella sp. TaxID=50422 RepID=UPI003F35377E
MRLSQTQKAALTVLLLLQRAQEQRGDTQRPIMATDLLKIINDTRDTPVFGSNFRAGMHTLHQHGLVRQWRTRSLALAYRLSDIGYTKAIEITNKPLSKN